MCIVIICHNLPSLISYTVVWTNAPCCRVSGICWRRPTPAPGTPTPWPHCPSQRCAFTFTYPFCVIVVYLIFLLAFGTIGTPGFCYKSKDLYTPSAFNLERMLGPQIPPAHVPHTHVHPTPQQVTPFLLRSIIFPRWFPISGSPRAGAPPPSAPPRGPLRASHRRAAHVPLSDSLRLWAAGAANHDNMFSPRRFFEFFYKDV